jgi:hypothetical protein
MSESGDKKELGGFARSIDALFSGASEPEPAPEVEAPDDDIDPFIDLEGAAVSDVGAALEPEMSLDPLAPDAPEDIVVDFASLAPDQAEEALLAPESEPLEGGAAADVMWAEVPDEVEEDEPVPVPADSAALSAALDAFLASPRLEGEEQAREIREMVGALRAANALDALADAMVVVEQMVEDNRWFVIRNAVAILGEVGGDRAVGLITSTLAHTDGRVRREALLALAKLGGEDAGMLVYGMLEDPDPDTRLAAAMAAGELKVERALKPLLGILDSESDESVTVAILQALGKRGDPGAVNSIEKHATVSFFSKSPLDVRIAAYRALYNIGTPHARRLINQAVDDKDPEVKAAVRDMIGMS